MENLAFINVAMLAERPASIYQPAGLTRDASESITLLRRKHYELFFLADVDATLHVPVREWLCYRCLLHGPYPDERDPGTLDRVFFRPWVLPADPEHHHFWRVTLVQALAGAHQAKHLFVFDPDHRVLEALTGDVEQLYSFSLDSHARFTTFLEQNLLTS